MYAEIITKTIQLLIAILFVASLKALKSADWEEKFNSHQILHGPGFTGSTWMVTSINRE